MRLSLCVAGCGSYYRTVLQDIHDMVSEFRDRVVEDREPSMSGHEALSDRVVVLGRIPLFGRRLCDPSEPTVDRHTLLGGPPPKTEYLTAIQPGRTNSLARYQW